MWRLLVPVVALVACRAPAPAASSPEPRPVAPPVAAAPAPGPGSEVAMESPFVLHVAFVVQPVVGEQPPVLAVTVRNPSARAVPFVRFTDPRCFAQYHLDLRISRPDGQPLALAPCAAKDWPGSDGSLAANGEERVRLPLAELAGPAESWPTGSYAIAVGWDPAALERARDRPAPRASQTSLNERSFAIARALATVRVERGKTVTLPDGTRFTFEAHGHKRVMAGDTSPLIIHGAIAPRGQAAEEAFSIHVDTELERLWRVGDGWAFELVDYQYDAWMELRYFGQLRRPTR